MTLEIPITRTDKGSALTLPSVLDLSMGPALQQALLDAFSNEGAIRIDCSAVEQMSTTAVQVFLAAARMVEESGREAVLVEPSEAFVLAFDDLGLYAEMMKWSME